MALTICASGFSEEEKAAIETKVKQLGGVFTKDLTNEVKVLICSKANSDKYSMSKAVLDIPIVTVDWLEASIKEGEFVPEYSKYGLRALTNCRLYLHKVGADVRARAKRLGAELSSAMTNVEYIVTSAKCIRTLPHFYTEDIVVSEDWLVACETAKMQVPASDYLLPRPQIPADQSVFLGGCIVYLNVVGKEELEELKALVTLGGGTWTRKSMRCVTHVVSDSRFEAGRAWLVKPEWLKQCIMTRSKVSERAFLLE